MLVDRKELDGGDPERRQVVDRRRRCHSGVGSAELLWHVWMEVREPLHVDLVDQGAFQRSPEARVAAPDERRIDDDALRHERRGVPVVGLLLIGTDAVAEQRVVPLDRAVDALRIRIDQQLGRVEPMPSPRLVGAVDAIAVPLPGAPIGQVRVPDEVGLLDEADALLLAAVVVEEAEVDRIGVLGEDREVDAGPVPGRSERVRVAAPDPQRHDGAAEPGAGVWAIGLTGEGYPPPAGGAGRMRRNSLTRMRPRPCRTTGGISRRAGSTTSSGSTSRILRRRTSRIASPAAMTFFTH